MPSSNCLEFPESGRTRRAPLGIAIGGRTGFRGRRRPYGVNAKRFVGGILVDRFSATSSLIVGGTAAIAGALLLVSYARSAEAPTGT